LNFQNIGFLENFSIDLKSSTAIVDTNRFISACIDKEIFKQYFSKDLLGFSGIIISSSPK